MAALPKTIEDSPTVKAIYAAYEKASSPRLSRRIGASIVGHRCARKVWYDFRWAGREEHSGRMLRLFQTGHLEENRFAEDLRSIGCEVHLADESGNQFEFTSASGHLVCKIDSAIRGIPEAPQAWHTGEFKTHSAKSFGEVKRKGLKSAKPEHYAQLAIGMHLSEMPRGLYLARNKDTDELYSERLRIEEVQQDAENLIRFAEQIVAAKTAPPRIGEAKDFPCSFCPHNARCHGSAPPSPAVPVLITCRSCVHASPVPSGWRCEKHNRPLDRQAQERACPDHLFIPDFVTFAEVTDGGFDSQGDWISFRNPDGSTWEHSRRKSSAYQSSELTILPSPMVGYPGGKSPSIHDLKSSLGGTVVEVIQ